MRSVRIAYTSDLHIDVTGKNRSLIPYLAEAVETSSADVFVIAGDVANTSNGIDAALTSFAGLQCTKLFVPGNHDVWVESRRDLRRGNDSWKKLDAVLPRICEQRGFTFLPGHPVIVGGVAFVGSLGWYDYSLADPRLAGVLNCLDYARGEFLHPAHKTGQWNDVRFAIWLKDNRNPDWSARRNSQSTETVFEELLRRFQDDLRRIHALSRAVVVVSHTSPFRECVPLGVAPDPFDAYEGSSRLGDILRSLAQQTPTYAIIGHRHALLDTVVEGVRVLRSPVGYLEQGGESLEEIARRCIGIVEV